MKKNELSLGDAIKEMVNTYHLKDKLNQSNIIINWEKIMGKTIAQYTSNIYVKDQKLFLKVDSAPLKNELNYAKSKIIEIVNKEAGYAIIKDVIIY